MSVNDGIGGLNKALRNLHIAWDRTADGWQDHLRPQFEADHLEPMVVDAKAAVNAMNRLAELFARVRRDCSR
jgi:hypothetical protein